MRYLTAKDIESTFGRRGSIVIEGQIQGNSSLDVQGIYQSSNRGGLRFAMMDRVYDVIEDNNEIFISFGIERNRISNINYRK